MKIQQQGHEDLFDQSLQKVTPKMVDRSKVRPVVPTQPHEWDTFPQPLGDPPRSVDFLGVGIQIHLQHHLRMEARRASPFVSRLQRPQIHPLYESIDHPYQVIFRN